MADRARRERPRGITSHIGYEPLYVKNTKTNGFLDSDSDDDYFRKQTKAQKSEMEIQDKHLEDLHSSVKRLGTLSLTIGDELEAQNQMLSDLDTDLDATQARMERVNRMTKDLIQKTGGLGWFSLVVILVIIAIVLFFLVLYT